MLNSALHDCFSTLSLTKIPLICTFLELSEVCVDGGTVYGGGTNPLQCNPGSPLCPDGVKR